MYIEQVDNFVTRQNHATYFDFEKEGKEETKQNYFSKALQLTNGPGTTHFNPSILEAEAIVFLRSRPARSTKQVLQQPVLHMEILPQKKKMYNRQGLLWGNTLFLCF